jgi:CO/xanthine dehydrogenase Mo-binding subunit
MIDPASATVDLPRRDARDKLRGRTLYTVDRGRPGMLHAAIRRAETASAKLVRLDLGKALATPGVRAIITASDAPGLHGIGVADQPLFARDRIRYYGEPVAAVAADTFEIATAAAAAIVIEYEERPAAITMAEALGPKAPLVHPGWRDYEILFEGGARRDNVAWEATVVRGDCDAAFARPDVVVVEEPVSRWATESSEF